MSIYRGRNKNEIYLASLLYDAIEDCDLRSVKTLLSVKGADPNLVLPKTKISPFHLAIGNDSEKFAFDVTALILQHGGNPNVQSDDGLTPIHIAAAWGRYDILKLLLDCGGDPEIRDINKKTALHYAVEEKFFDCYKLLKLYLTDKAAIFNKEKEDCIHYAINLDKILVNNGTTLGEYEIVNEYKTDSIFKNMQKLQDLPQSDSKEYVMSWFNSLQNIPSMMNKILTSNGSTTGISEDYSGDSLKESDEERHSHVNIKNICFRKVYRKKVKSPKAKSSPIKTNNQLRKLDSSEIKHFSKESGITMLSDSLFSETKNEKLDLDLIAEDKKENDDKIKLNLDLSKGGKDTTSDYVTCTSGDSPDILERNVFDFNSLMTNDDSNKSVKSQVSLKSEGISSSDLSFVSVSEVYKYVDQEEGIVLYERRFLKTPISDCNGSVKSFVSSKHSLPETIDYEDYDPETIRRELTLLGYNPGPVTVTTKRIYLKKLKQLKKLPAIAQSQDEAVATKVYSEELEKTLKNPDWLKDIALYKTLEETVLRQFTTPDPSKKWREGSNKSSFTYLLLDPRITNNLPLRAESLKPKEIWETFLSAVFYVGKGKRSRPYNHLYDAVNLWNQGQRTSDCKKLNKILNIWSDDCGVVCLHLFQNSIPVEAYTREAAIIDALKIDNLCNMKGGNFYGVAATWSQKKKTMLGVYLLYKAMMIFLNEGERQLCPSDIN